MSSHAFIHSHTCKTLLVLSCDRTSHTIHSSLTACHTQFAHPPLLVANLPRSSLGTLGFLDFTLKPDHCSYDSLSF